MANNYVIFDKNGLLADSQTSPISKGNNKVDTFYVSFAGHDYNDTYVTVATTLPDGESLPELATSVSDFGFKEENYKGYKFVIIEALTSKAGTLTITFHLKSKEDDRRLCSSVINVTIHDSDVVTEPTIDTAQYENLVTTIDTGLKDLDEKKLDKDFSKYSNDATTTDEDLVVLRRKKENINIKVKDFHNVLTVNGVEPVEKNIQLVANDIRIEDGTTIEDKLNELNEEKAPMSLVNTKVSYREGNFDVGEHYSPVGVLSHYTEEFVDVYDIARITLVDTEFQDGDILTCDLSLTFSKDGLVNSYPCSFTRLLSVGAYYQNQVVHTGRNDEMIAIGIYIVTDGNRCIMRVPNSSGYAIKPSINHCIIRR